MITRVFYDIASFRDWLGDNGYSYLENGVGGMLVGDAVMEIARRAGVRGLQGHDSIAATLPLIASIIKLRCKPR